LAGKALRGKATAMTMAVVARWKSNARWGLGDDRPHRHNTHDQEHISVSVGNIDNLSVGTLAATEPSGRDIDASDRRIIDAKLVGSDLFALAEIPRHSMSSAPSSLHRRS
jgi:hypothetical protein